MVVAPCSSEPSVVAALLDKPLAHLQVAPRCRVLVVGDVEGRIDMALLDQPAQQGVVSRPTGSLDGPSPVQIATQVIQHPGDHWLVASFICRCQERMPDKPPLVTRVQQGEAQPVGPLQQSQPPLASPLLEERFHRGDQSAGKRRVVAPEEWMIHVDGPPSFPETIFDRLLPSERNAD